jgi:hypothetical protein
VSEQTNNAVILDYYGWSPEEYRHMAKNMLLSQKVAYSMDKDALSTIHKVADAVSKGTNISFSKLATSISKQTGTTVNYGTSGWVPKFNQDGGLSIEAVKLKIKGVSSVVRSSTGKGYYILRLLDINDSQVKYEYIQVPLTAFAKSLEKIEKDHKVTRYISVPELSDQAQTN